MVPQSMAYAGLAQLPVQFGLYSSFMGVLIYWFFATSKDITIGVSFPSVSPLGKKRWTDDRWEARRGDVDRHRQCRHQGDPRG